MHLDKMFEGIWKSLLLYEADVRLDTKLNFFRISVSLDAIGYSYRPGILL